MQHDLIEPPGSHQKFSRSGKRKSWKVAVTQLLNAGHSGGEFIAVVRDPETRQVLSRTTIWISKSDEMADLTIECLRGEDEHTG